MDPKIAKLTTIEQCTNLEENARRRGRPDLAAECRVRAVQIRAEAAGAKTVVEKECFEALYAYEAYLTEKNGRTTRAGRVWPKIKKSGILKAVDGLVSKPKESVGYAALAEMGLEWFSFEAVVVRHPDPFSEDARKYARTRMADRNR